MPNNQQAARARGCKPIAIVAVAAAVAGFLFAAPSVSAAPPVSPTRQAMINAEVACMKAYAADPANNYLNYAPAIGAPEVTDAIHSGLQPCATFADDNSGQKHLHHTGRKYQVAQFLSPTVYPGQIQLIVQGGPNAAFLVGGAPGTPIPSYTGGPYVARFNPTTGAQIWRTPLPQAPGQWIAAPSGAVVKGGWVDVAVGPNVYKLNPKTGAIVASVQQPVLAGAAIDTNFDGFAVAPDANGTILLKSQNRSAGCPIQGNQAMSTCVAQFGPQPVTTVVAIDPITLRNISAITLNQAVASRPTVVSNKGNSEMYLAGSTQGVRVIWNPKTKKLSQDLTWAPSYLLPGQNVGDAPVPVGDWVVFNNNAFPTQGVPICAVAVRMTRAADIHRICPWGTTLPAGVTSNAPASFSTDPEKSLIFMQDLLVGGVFAVHLDQTTGEMITKWSRPDWRTSDYFTSVGPSNHRVLSSQYLSPTFNAGQLGNNSWTEGVLWVDESTGKTLAQSAYNGPTQLGWMAMPSYAGRFYTMTTNGTLNIYVPQACATTGKLHVSPPSTTTCSTDYAALPQPIAYPAPKP
jgi:hypothetical protein